LPEGVRPVKQSEARPPIAAASIPDTPIEENESEEETGNDAQKDSVDQETPTSGIEESPVNHNDFNPPEINYNTLPNSVENTNHEEANLLNGNAEVDNDSDSPIDGQLEDSHINESSVDRTNLDNMDITIDSVKDHLT
jgi:hypothetical protein